MKTKEQELIEALRLIYGVYNAQTTLSNENVKRIESLLK